jgi:hypothetical protein
MISGVALTFWTLLYIALLFATAVYADRRREMGRSITANAWIYALSFGIFHTSWTFYGNVGRVATVGIDFFAFYLGVTLIIFSWWYLLRKMIRISKGQNIVSIADFIASRYGKSLPLCKSGGEIGLRCRNARAILDKRRVFHIRSDHDLCAAYRFSTKRLLKCPGIHRSELLCHGNNVSRCQ